MRLTANEQRDIADAARAVLPAGSRVALFGSRTDDSRRGGDIDLLVEPPTALDASEAFKLNLRLTTELQLRMGERRIDVLVVPADAADGRLIVAEARRQAVDLVKT